MDFPRYLLNSVVVATLVTVCQVFFSAMAAYAFARLRWPGRDAVYAVFLAGLMVPTIFTLLPNFLLVRDLGLLDTLPGIALPTMLMTPFAVFFLRQFFAGISFEIEEAAKLDGAGRFGRSSPSCCPWRRPPWSRSRSSRTSRPGTTTCGLCS